MPLKYRWIIIIDIYITKCGYILQIKKSIENVK